MNAAQDLPNVVIGVCGNQIGRYPTVFPEWDQNGPYKKYRGRFDDPLPENWEEIKARLGSQRLPANVQKVTDTLLRSNFPLGHQIAPLHEELGVTDIICLVQNPKPDIDGIAPVIYSGEMETLRALNMRVHNFPIFARPLLEDEQVIDDLIFVYEEILKRDGKAMIHCLKWATRTGMAVEFILAHEELKKRGKLWLIYKMRAMLRFMTLNRGITGATKQRINNRNIESQEGTPVFMQKPKCITSNWSVLTKVLPRLEKILNQNTPSEKTRFIASQLFGQ